MKTNRLFLIAALLGTTLVGCQKEAETQTPDGKSEVEKTWTLTVKATKNLETKAMELDGTILNASWNTNEKVAVYNGETLLGTLTVTAVDETTKEATLSGEIPVDGLTTSSTLTLLYPGREDGLWTYLGQDASAPSVSGNLNQFDYATSSLGISELNTDTNTIIASTEKVDFTNEQSIYRFGFKTTDHIAVKSILLASSANQLVRSRSISGSTWGSTCGLLLLSAPVTNSDGFYYLSVRNENTTANDTYTFNVVGNDDALYEGTKTIGSSNLGQGKFLSAKNIAVSQKTFAPATGSISEEADVI